jgi:hypothetical protein
VHHVDVYFVISESLFLHRQFLSVIEICFVLFIFIYIYMYIRTHSMTTMGGTTLRAV